MMRCQRDSGVFGLAGIIMTSLGNWNVKAQVRMLLLICLSQGKADFNSKKAAAMIMIDNIGASKDGDAKIIWNRRPMNLHNLLWIK